MDFYFEESQSELFDVEAQITEDQITQLEEKLGTLSGDDVAGLFRAKNHFSIGTPVSYPITEKDTTQREVPGHLSGYEFWRVQLACTFSPHPSCYFQDARLEVTLISEPANSLAIAYDLFPIVVEDEKKISKKLSVGADMKIKVTPIEVELGMPLPKLEHGQEWIQYTSRIQAHGLQESKVFWEFTKTENRELKGSQPLFMVVCKPAGSKVKARLQLDTSVVIGLKIGETKSIPLSTTWRKHGNVVDEPDVELC